MKVDPNVLDPATGLPALPANHYWNIRTTTNMFAGNRVEIAIRRRVLWIFYRTIAWHWCWTEGFPTHLTRADELTPELVSYNARRCIQYGLDRSVEDKGSHLLGQYPPKKAAA